jgi:Domain of unknown function (DUF1877)
MGCLGVHFALSADEAARLKSFATDAERLEFLTEELEENYFGEHDDLLAQSDKAWDGIHRTLTDGRFAYDNGEYPLNHVIMGGEILYGNSDYIMVLKTPQHVVDIARAIQSITEEDFKSRYRKIDQRECDWPLSKDDCNYSWDWFQGVRDLFQRAAKENRFVLFTASQ